MITQRKHLKIFKIKVKIKNNIYCFMFNMFNLFITIIIHITALCTESQII